MQPGLPGSSGRTWSASCALSRSSRIRLPSSSVRSSALCASRAGGTFTAGTPSASKNHCSAVPGCIGALAGSNPRRFTYSWPSGKRGPACLANRIASVDLPTPAVPVISATEEACGTLPRFCDAPGSSACSQSSSAVRPTKPAGSDGSCAGLGAGSADVTGDSAVAAPREDTAEDSAADSAEGAEEGRPATGRGSDPGSTRACAAGGPSSTGSIASTCWWILVSSVPGSMPRSSASRARASWNTCSASACLPHRYRAIISSPRAGSRSGCSATSAVSSATAAADWPCASIKSARSTAAVVRSSASRTRSASANGPGTPANAWPRHSPSASSTTRAAPSVSLEARSARDLPRHSSNWPASRPPGPSRSR